jgi:hypothetical protein
MLEYGRRTGNDTGACSVLQGSCLGAGFWWRCLKLVIGFTSISSSPATQLKDGAISNDFMQVFWTEGY